MMLLIGMFAAVSVRNQMHKMTRSLPLDILAVVSGIAVLIVFATEGYIVMQVPEWSFMMDRCNNQIRVNL